MTKYRILKVTEDDYDKVKRAFGRTSHPEYAVCGFVDLELAPPTAIVTDCPKCGWRIKINLSEEKKP